MSRNVKFSDKTTEVSFVSQNKKSDFISKTDVKYNKELVRQGKAYQKHVNAMMAAHNVEEYYASIGGMFNKSTLKK